MTAAAEHPPSPEPDRVSRAWIWFGGALFVVFVVASIFVARALEHGFASGAPMYAPAPPRAAPEIGIVEQSLTRESRRGLDLADEQRRDLQRWGWVDPAHGVARIPIDRAMDLVVQQAERPGEK